MVVDHINVSCVYEGNINTAWFDDLSLVCTTVQSYEYDSKGNPVTSSSTNLNDQSMEYEDNGNITSVTSRGVTSTYEYDDTFTHRLISSSNSIIKSELEHDDVGNVEKTTLSNATDTTAKKIITSSEYINSGNLAASVTDTSGNKTEYIYRSFTDEERKFFNIAASCDSTSAFYETFGLPSIIRDTKGNETQYITDTYGRVRQIESFGKNETTGGLEKYASLKYTYYKTMLYEIQRTTGTDVQKYHFLYDNFGNTTSIGIGGWNSSEQITLASYEYAAMNGLLTTQTYGNGDKVEFTYDILGRAKTTTYKDENGNVDRVLTYVYTGDGQLYSIHDSRTGFLYLYTYDSIGRLIGSSVKNADGEVLMSTRQEYNANNQLVGQHWTVGTTTYSETYTYSTADGALTSYNNALGQTINLEYDALRRISKVDTTTLDRFYEYADGKESGQTTGLVSKYWYHTANYDDAYFKYSYSYDALGNISSYTQSGTTYTYTYDDQNQLKTQTGGGKTYTYTYDNAGNILTASNGTNTNNYTYGNALWRDQLTAFNGQTITYDGSGNPLSYYNGKRYTFTWEEGRNLVSAVQGTNTYTYAYDSNGLRVSKTINGVKHEYLYASGRLLRETYGDVILEFEYDHNGHPFALRYTAGGTTTNYYYITNLQGDVLTMITGQGVAVASYSYDPYGKVLTATGEMANINPLRYRGYYYDAETGFYYLQSRYYDPAICRFINADSYVSTGEDLRGLNMYAYCMNAPACMIDPDGEAANIWYYLFTNHDPGFIHRIVQLHILATYNVYGLLYSKEFVMPGVGRADIIKPKTMEIWEIKYIGKDIQARIDQATNQVNNYVTGFAGVKPGAALEFFGAFVINCCNVSYLITYFTPFPGVILYTVSALGIYQESAYKEYVPSKVSSTAPATPTVPSTSAIPYRDSSSLQSGIIVGLGICAIGGAGIYFFRNISVEINIGESFVYG